MDLKTQMKEAGIVGAGGAGFPSYGKLASGADTIVINGAECEPLLYTDYILLQREMPEVLAGIKAVVDYLSVPRALLCVKDHTAKRLDLRDGEKLGEKIYLKILPDVYPMGDEISLIYQATGRVVKPGNLPITAGVIVYNVETAYNVAMAISENLPVTDKWLTVAGNVKEPIVTRVPVGTSVSELLKNLGVIVPEDHVVLDGGPSMGKVINPERATVTKTTKGLLILPKSAPSVENKFLDGEKSVKRAETACCQCTRCTDLCPRALLGYPLEPHKMVRTAKSAVKLSPELVISATLCCGCGICETLACCQGISPKAVINEYKLMLAKERMRFTSDKEVKPEAERDLRMIPSERWEEVSGVKKFDRVASFKEPMEFNSVQYNIRQHIGAPGVPVVKTGDKVSKGDLILQAQEGLSLPAHAPISGTVTVYEDKIIIKR